MTLIDIDNDRAVIGGNEPPGAIDFARDAFRSLRDFLAETPVIQDQKTAVAAKVQLDRMKATLGDLDDAKTAEAQPHYEQWQAALEKYRQPRVALEKLTDELKERIKAFLDAEEKRRRQEAERIRLEAEEAVRRAEEAARAEAEARENASFGEIGADIGGAIEDLAHAATEAAKLERKADIAERDADNVRLGGGFGRSISVRVTMKPVVLDYKAAIKAIGLTEDITAAILKGSRAYKMLKGQWPKGIGETEERNV